MLTVYNYERIRRAYYIEKESVRQIEREFGHSYWTVRKALDSPEPTPYRLKEAKVAPVLGLYQAQIEQLLMESAKLSRKQRYTSKQIYKTIRKNGYPGAESTGAQSHFYGFRQKWLNDASQVPIVRQN